MGTRQKHQGTPWLYDDVTGDIVGVKDPDGSELYFMRVPHVGSFYDMTTQTVDAENEPQAMTFNTTAFSKGITMVAGSKITMSRKATYNIQFSAQMDRTASGVDAVSVWLRKNGVDVADSCTDVTISGGANAAKVVAAWNFFVEALAGDYFELMWSTPDDRVTLHYAAARTNPTRPAIPSIILTVNEVDGSYP